MFHNFRESPFPPMSEKAKQRSAQLLELVPGCKSEYEVDLTTMTYNERGEPRGLNGFDLDGTLVSMCVRCECPIPKCRCQGRHILQNSEMYDAEFLKDCLTPPEIDFAENSAFKHSPITPEPGAELVIDHETAESSVELGDLWDNSVFAALPPHEQAAVRAQMGLEPVSNIAARELQSRLPDGTTHPRSVWAPDEERGFVEKCLQCEEPLKNCLCNPRTKHFVPYMYRVKGPQRAKMDQSDMLGAEEIDWTENAVL